MAVKKVKPKKAVKRRTVKKSVKSPNIQTTLHKAEKKGISPKRLGISFGLFLAFWLSSVALLSGMMGWGSAVVRMLSSFYLGYSASLLGAIIGSIWGFIDGFICGYIFAYIYNWTAKFD